MGGRFREWGRLRWLIINRLTNKRKQIGIFFEVTSGDEKEEGKKIYKEEEEE